MDTDSWIKLGILLVCLLSAAFASLAEASLTAANRVRLHRLMEEGVKRAHIADRLLEEPYLVSTSVLLLNSLAVAGAAALATALSLRWLSPNWALVVAALIVGLVVLTFCEVLPRVYAAQKPERAALAVVRPVQVLTWLLWPLVRLVSLVVDVLLPLLGVRRVGTAPVVTEDELRLLVGMTEGEGLIEQDEKEMIRGIFELEETTAREIMVPRIDIAAVDTEASVLDAVDLIVRRGYSRIPLYEGTIDNIVGILYAKDLLPHLRSGQPLPQLQEIARPPYFIPESKKIDDLLHELQQKKVHIAIVVDEYGGTAGLVTIEDLLEEIVGEIQDEYDREEAQVERVSDNEAILDGRVGIGELNDIFGVLVASDSFDTIGGFVYNQLGKIPSPGDAIDVEDLTISVLSTVGKRIKKVQVVRKPAA